MVFILMISNIQSISKPGSDNGHTSHSDHPLGLLITVNTCEKSRTCLVLFRAYHNPITITGHVTKATTLGFYLKVQPHG
ncbi:hypothetical protein DPMN_110323 [Dreissena polymorpha]|uniref:Uncharacterized protein n=1 Tax=Dreissena polymorpha TaxID=45954 RepID=A0A9D4KBU5_DREPO|nr:hypothetical protein DPMN_110323 [Dreissena polymorpha]